MVKRLIVRMLIEYGTPIVKSFLKAYKQTAKRKAETHLARAKPAE